MLLINVQSGRNCIEDTVSDLVSFILCMFFAFVYDDCAMLLNFTVLQNVMHHNSLCMVNYNGNCLFLFLRCNFCWVWVFICISNSVLYYECCRPMVAISGLHKLSLWNFLYSTAWRKIGKYDCKVLMEHMYGVVHTCGCSAKYCGSCKGEWIDYICGVLGCIGEYLSMQLSTVKLL